MTKVLVVEDDPSTLMAVTALLEVTGLEQIKSAGNGIEALESLRKEQPELMFLDLMMPQMDGFEVLRELRGGSAPRPGHIIVMSAHANAEDREGVKSLGADQFIAKPFTLAQLEETLEKAGIGS